MSLPEVVTNESTFSAVQRQAKILLASGFLPKSIKTVEQTMTIMMKGQEVGLPATESLSKIYIVDGKPSMAAETMRALIHRAFPNSEAIHFDRVTSSECVIVAQRPGGKPQTFSYTMEDAQLAGLATRDNWKKHPKAMLISRCTSLMARTVFPDCLAGISHTPDELGAGVVMDDCGDTIEVVLDANDDARNLTKTLATNVAKKNSTIQMTN